MELRSTDMLQYYTINTRASKDNQFYDRVKSSIWRVPMEWHIKCDPDKISRYIFCPGDQKRAKKIADQFDTSHVVTESRGYAVYSGEYKGVFMTVCGTGMGGPAVAIGIEELAHMGGDTFIRVGSCGVFQEGQKPGDVIAASGTVRAGGTGNAYLPLIFPAVPTFSVLRSLVEAGEALNIPVTVGVGIAGDSFYGPRDAQAFLQMKEAGVVLSRWKVIPCLLWVQCATGGPLLSSPRMGLR